MIRSGLTRAVLPVLALAACSPQSDAAPVGEQTATANATANATDKVTDQTAVGRARIELVARNDSCVLRQAGRPDVQLAPAAPCRLLRADGKVQQYAYPDQKIDAVVMVAGTTADAAAKTHFGAAAGAECGTVAQGLIVRGDTVTAARQPIRGGMFCVDQGRDEKDFYAAAHEK